MQHRLYFFQKTTEYIESRCFQKFSPQISQEI